MTTLSGLAGRVHITEPPDGAFPQHLSTLHRDDLSAIYLTADVSNMTVPQAAITVMKALGKREDVTGMRDREGHNLHVLPCWLAAHNTQVVIIGSPQVWKPVLLNSLLRVLCASTAQIVLAPERHSYDEVAQNIAGYDPQPLRWDEIHQTLRSTATAPETNLSVLAGQHLPTSDWPTFRSDSRTLLPPDAFAEFDTRYRTAFIAARSHLNNPHTTVDDNNTRELLAHLIEESSNTPEAITAVRATQAAYFAHGYNLRIVIDKVVATLTHSRRTKYSPTDWHAIRAYRDPRRAAVCTLFGHNIAISDIPTITIADVRSALQQNSLGGTAINDHGRAYLHANLIHRSLQGATGTDPFITGKAAATTINTAANDIGLLIAARPNQQSIHTASIWKSSFGFLLKAIP